VGKLTVPNCSSSGRVFWAGGGFLQGESEDRFIIKNKKKKTSDFRGGEEQMQRGVARKTSGIGIYGYKKVNGV